MFWLLLLNQYIFILQMYAQTKYYCKFVVYLESGSVEGIGYSNC